jgi:uncharacterized membrane protein
MNKTRQIAEIATFAALYAILTWLFAPISYQIFQFRVPECLKSIVVSRRHLIWAFVLGNALSNIFSPFVGMWELLWMPLINVAGAGSAWIIGHRLQGTRGLAVGGAIYAIWVAFGVSFMLFMLFNVPLLLTFVYLLIPEVILIVGFSPVMKKVNDRIASRLG